VKRSAIWVFALVGFAAGCAPAVPGAPTGPAPGPAATPGLPPVPLVDGPLAVRIVHPTPGTVRPNTDSTFIYGSVGTGRADLTINGFTVAVEANGAFLAFLPMPPDGTFQLRARVGAQTAEGSLTYREPPPPPATPTPAPAVVDYPQPRAARVVGGADTLATGSDVAVGRPTPTGEYRWFLPRGARLRLTGERGDMVRAQLDQANVAWIPRNVVEVSGTAAPPVRVGAPVLQSAAGWTDVRIPLEGAPFRVQATDTALTITLHGVEAAAFQTLGGPDSGIGLIEQTATSADAARVRIVPRQRIWGYRAFYEPDGTLVVRVRRAPTVNPAAPLRGIRIAVDPGHPPGGATGPTGLTEAEANLAISVRLADQLRARGAEVLMTRTAHVEVPLGERVRMASDWNADLLISVHNNAFPEGVNPFRRNGTSTYFFHPFSAGFARAMNEEIVSVTLIRDLGAIAGNLALVRPTWMPSVLTESLFMPMPEQEAALRNAAFLDQLAAAHVRGIESFLLASQRPAFTELTRDRE
jgi:N-acetylmuramoyl-L-alanine amidase